MKPVVDALCALKGLSTLAAATILVTTGDLSRFRTAGQLMPLRAIVPCLGPQGAEASREQTVDEVRYR